MCTRGLGRAVTLWLLLGCVLGPAAAQESQEPAPADVQRHKQTILERIKREPPTYRGEQKGVRIRWEWYDGVVRSYGFEKMTLLEEASAGRPYLLRPRWAFRGMKLTFQELFALPPADDDKLLPILSHGGLLESAPAATFEGLTLYGKSGELKGVVSRKYIASEAEIPLGLTERIGRGNVVRNRYAFMPVLELKNAKGELEIARGVADDAFNARWRDIKDRIADDLSEEKAREDLRQLREAYLRTFKESARDR